MACSDLVGVFADETLARPDAKPNLAEKVTAISPDGACEQSTISPHSPGVVRSAEVVVRMIFSPHMVSSETGKVTEAAFSDVKNRGLSILRRELISDAAIAEQAIAKIAEDRRRGRLDTEYKGYISGSVYEIRTVGAPDRAFPVYDSSKANNVAHADVVQLIAGSDKALKRLRRELQKKFTDTPT